MNPTIEALIDIGTITERTLEIALTHWKLSVAQLRILDYVRESAGGLTPSELAALLLRETHSVSGVLNRLEDRGLIDRGRDRQDRRVVHVTLSAAGRTLLELAEKTWADAEAGLMEIVSKRDDVNTNSRHHTIGYLRDDLLPLLGQDKLVRRATAKATVVSG